MLRYKNVSTNVRIWLPSTSASAMMTILLYRACSRSKLSPTPAPIALIRACISALERILLMLAFSTLRILPRNGSMAWKFLSLPPLADPPAELPSTMYSSLLAGSLDEQSASLPGSVPRPRRLQSLVDDRLGFTRPLLQELGKITVGHALYETLDLRVPEFGLGLPLELGLPQLDRDDRGQTFPDVVAGKALLFLLEKTFLPGVGVDRP